MTAAERRAERKANPPLAMITLTVMLGLIMAIIDTSIVNVALNDMAGNLGSSIDEIGWVATFYINIPIGIVAFLMTLAFIRDPVYLKRERGPVDYIGLSLLTAGIASLQYVLERGQREDWFSSPTIVLLTVIAVVSLVVFCLKE